MKYTNTQGFSLVLALGMMIMMTSIALFILEFSVPFSRSVKWVEHAAKSFYQWYSALEHGLYDLERDIPQKEPSGDTSTVDEKTFFRYASEAVWSQIPISWWGNSEYDTDWNMISSSGWLSFFIPANTFTSINKKISFTFRVPDFDENGTSDSIKSGEKEVLLFQLSSSSDSISSKNLLSTDYSGNIFSLQGLMQGETLSNNSNTDFSTFYNAHCINADCVLRVAIVQKLIGGSQGQILPYLEWQLNSSKDMPTGVTTIYAEGHSYGYRKNLALPYSQKSTNAAFDFVVLQ